MAAIRLQPEQLRRPCDPERLPFQTTAELPPLDGMIGQERAVRAVQFGLRVRTPGYHVYLSGPPGTGKTTFALHASRREAATWPVPDDWVYLYNFNQPDAPLAVNLPAGQGRRFQRDMEEWVEDLRAAIPRIFEGDAFEHQRQLLLQASQERSARVLEELERDVRAQGFALQRTARGFVVQPVDPTGRPLSPEELAAWPAPEREAIERRSRQVSLLVAEAMRRVGAIEKEAREALRRLGREMAAVVLDPLLARLRERYGGHPVLAAWFDRLRDDVLERLEELSREGQEGDEAEGARGPGRDRGRRAAWQRYAVNLLVDNASSAGAPVVYEPNPTLHNLVGKVEYVSEFGTLTTDFTMIKPGALHRANGGVLILPVRELLASPGAWDALKRALRHGAIEIESPFEQLRAIPTRSLRPQPIPLWVKVLLVGTPETFRLLHDLDEDFPKLFKIRADFDTEMPRTEEHELGYARFIAGVCARDGLRPFDRTAVARVVEYSSRLAEDQLKVSTRFNAVAEVVHEAAAWAEAEGAPVVTAAHVDKAIREKIFRANRLEERLREWIQRGKLVVQVTGTAVGQVNGLAVLEVDDYAWAKPSRITARTFMGEKGIVHIEREVELSGEIHDKGVLTLTGYLGGRYAQDKPLSLSASITFEQLYEGIDGDSASSAELYALLSSLGEVPLRQDLAVTGSVDQRGEIQPVGGVNEKIEGFFRTCKALGLTGTQGVIIPARNVDNLMLDHEVIEAVRQGLFHIYAVHTVDEGLELLTGLPAEEVHRRVDAKLAAYAEGIAEYGRKSEQRDGEGQGDEGED